MIIVNNVESWDDEEKDGIEANAEDNDDDAMKCAESALFMLFFPPLLDDQNLPSLPLLLAEEAAV
jgi:hypothetical protein